MLVVGIDGADQPAWIGPEIFQSDTGAFGGGDGPAAQMCEQSPAQQDLDVMRLKAEIAGGFFGGEASCQDFEVQKRLHFGLALSLGC